MIDEEKYKKFTDLMFDDEEIHVYSAGYSYDGNFTVILYGGDVIESFIPTYKLDSDKSHSAIVYLTDLCQEKEKLAKEKKYPTNFTVATELRYYDILEIPIGYKELKEKVKKLIKILYKYFNLVFLDITYFTNDKKIAMNIYSFNYYILLHLDNDFNILVIDVRDKEHRKVSQESFDKVKSLLEKELKSNGK